MEPLVLPALGPMVSPIERLCRTSRPTKPASVETPLLTAVRAALSGRTNPVDATSSSSISNHVIQYYSEDIGSEESLSWDDKTLVYAVGNVIRKQWTFDSDGESIQYALFAHLEQDLQALSLQQPTLEASHPNNPGESNWSTFSPFHHLKPPSSKRSGPRKIRMRGIFVFLRTFGYIHLLSGLDYRFNLPFPVRKAWPAYPHGVLVQRYLPQHELDDARVSGDIPVPTFFSLMTPFAEMLSVGLTAGITGVGVTTTLTDEEENRTRALRSVPAEEVVLNVFTSFNPANGDNVILTLNTSKRLISIWRYAYIKPIDTPLPLEKRRRKQRAGADDVMVGDVFAFSNLPPIVAGMAPALSSGVTMESLMRAAKKDTNGIIKPPVVIEEPKTTLPDAGTTRALPARPARRDSLGRRGSLTRNDLSVTMDRMALGSSAEPNDSVVFPDFARMNAAFWMEKLYSFEVAAADAQAWPDIQTALFDQREDGRKQRELLSVCLRESATLLVFAISEREDHSYTVETHAKLPAVSAVSVCATRPCFDLLVVKPSSETVLLTHGIFELPVSFNTTLHSTDVPRRPIAVREVTPSAATLIFEHGPPIRVSVDLIVNQAPTCQVLEILSMTLPAEEMFCIHRKFLQYWVTDGRSLVPALHFRHLVQAIFEVLGIDHVRQPQNALNVWQALGASRARERLSEDSVLSKLHQPRVVHDQRTIRQDKLRHGLVGPTLHALHSMAQELRLWVNAHQSVFMLAPVIYQLAMIVRPQWGDYWKRLCPHAVDGWSKPSNTSDVHDQRLPLWPPDALSMLFARLDSAQEHSWIMPADLAADFGIEPSFGMGRLEALPVLNHLSMLYGAISDAKIADTRKRAEAAINLMMRSPIGPMDMMQRLPLGLASPLKEAARTCQFAPAGNWSSSAYQLIGRNDLAEGVAAQPDRLSNEGYRSAKDFVSGRTRISVNQIAARVTSENSAADHNDGATGTELYLPEFTAIRFGHDKRLEEVARMLSSSVIPGIKLIDRPDLSEHDLAKEHQHQVQRVAERTLALPYGRAMFTYASTPNMTRETFHIPRMEFSIRLLPQNTTIAAEPGKILSDCSTWGEFHNGVAAGLRISPSSRTLSSSWIAFNKPHELTPEHAGFLYALGLNGHLREMMTWHTFNYLTPKHDLTSIGVLLGLASAFVGTGDGAITKILSVHVPALLPTPDADLNVSLIAQTAGIAGTGILHMGTKNRRLAEVCLSQLVRKDLIQPDISNDHREAYTLAAALAFGMIMLGKGSKVPADEEMLDRLRMLVHGDAGPELAPNGSKSSFDCNLTSPAATIAVGLMYLRTGRQDVADMLSIPRTVVELNRIQPNFVVLRALSKCLVMWDSIRPSSDWVSTQMPVEIQRAMDARFKGATIDDALEQAYYNILAGCSFAIALRYAGTAREEAYLLVIGYYDLFSRLSYTNSVAFDHRIKRSGIREGLNLLSISLSMIMAGTGEINCLRRLRYAFGMYNQPVRYGTCTSTHMSLGLLFLGGGRFTLGTSDAAIASMVTAFFPRFPHVSSDNRCYLQALRHLWVLAVEPRCLIARDVDTKEIVYLPVKVKVKEADNAPITSQLISPTLIPSLDRLLSIRVDTPRYWPIYLDIAAFPRHRDGLLRSQTLYVKRRTAFLSYQEDPKGSRSLFVRSGQSTGEAAMLDFPKVASAKLHPAGDLNRFIGSFSNDILFLAFAVHFCRGKSDTEDERLFHNYAHASLLDAIIQDKPQALQSLVTVYKYRTMSPRSRYFGLRMQDLRFACEFYSRTFDRRLSGRPEGPVRMPLIREATVAGALHAQDAQLDEHHSTETFRLMLQDYANGRVVSDPIPHATDSDAVLAWYLTRHSVPTASVLVALKALARQAHQQCIGRPPPTGVLPGEENVLDAGIKLVLQSTGNAMSVPLGTGWTDGSLNEICECWKL